MFLLLSARAEGRLNFLPHETLDLRDILLFGEYNHQQNRLGYRLNISCLIPCHIVDHSDRVF